jgi:hypothetical protein
VSRNAPPYVSGPQRPTAGAVGRAGGAGAATTRSLTPLLPPIIVLYNRSLLHPTPEEARGNEMHGLPPDHPALRQGMAPIYRSMKTWCELGGHYEARPFVCDRPRCWKRVCGLHSSVVEHRRVCEDCVRKGRSGER